VNELRDEAIRLFLLDDHDVVRMGLRELLEATGECRVVGEAAGPEEALARIDAVTPDVALLDVQLGDGSGVEVCREIRARWPEVRCIMLTSFADDEALMEAVLAGASGYLLKRVTGSDVLGAVRRVAAGESLIDPRLLDRVRQRLQGVDADDPLTVELTTQQRHILDLIGEGLTNRQIAERMCLAEKTVKNYVSIVLTKMGMTRRAEAAAHVARLHERHRDDFR